MLHWKKVTYRAFALYWLIPLAFWGVMIGVSWLIGTNQEGYGADPNMSPRQAQDSSEQISLE